MNQAKQCSYLVHNLVCKIHVSGYWLLRPGATQYWVVWVRST